MAAVQSPRRSLRLLLAGLIGILVLGCSISPAEDVRSDADASGSAAWSTAKRHNSARAVADGPDLVPLGLDAYADEASPALPTRFSASPVRWTPRPGPLSPSLPRAPPQG
jgi:hypothetical protein